MPANPQVRARVLLVDDDEELRELVTKALEGPAFSVAAVAGGTEALGLLGEHDFDAILADVTLAGMSGIELCARVAGTRPDIPVIIITGHGSMDTAIAAIRAGAYDYLTKPLSIPALSIALHRAVGHHQIQREVRRLREVVEGGRRRSRLLGESPAIRRVCDLVDRVAASPISVLITGETGTGKELVARALHARSPRPDGPFIAINCAAMPPALLESELFGHVRGAFTDATRDHAGLLCQARGGTLLLDAIGDMPREMQRKLLRALPEREVRPVGGGAEVSFDVRLLSATSRDLESAVAEKRFRDDLYYRIAVVVIAVPPPRARGDDALLLAQHFLRGQAARSGKEVASISPEAARKLLEYDWPGNVRELENCMGRAVALARFSEICVDDLPDKVRLHESARFVIDTTNPAELIPMEEMERRYLQRVLAAVGGNKSHAARVLGLDRHSLYRRLKRLDTGKAD